MTDYAREGAEGRVLEFVGEKRRMKLRFMYLPS